MKKGGVNHRRLLLHAVGNEIWSVMGKGGIASYKSVFFQLNKKEDKGGEKAT